MLILKLRLMKFHEFTEAFDTYLTDEAGFIKGTASRIFFPENTADVQFILKNAYSDNCCVTVSGGGTGVSGGRVPLEGWILATDRMLSVDGGKPWTDDESGIEYKVALEKTQKYTTLRVPPAMTIKAIQNYVREHNLYYPPDPTERSSFIGGNVATNASGSRSFKHGVTKDWVEGIVVVLPQGECITLNRNEIISENKIEIPTTNYYMDIPNFYHPETRKNVAGPVVERGEPVMNLFIGSGGLFGVVTEVTLRLLDKPSEIMNMFVYCKEQEVALQLIDAVRAQRDTNTEPIPLSVEYLDDRSSAMIHKKDSSVPMAKAIVILEQEFRDETEMDSYLDFYMSKFEELGIEDTSVAQTYKEIEHHKELRHVVPETVNALVKSYGQSKLGTDYAVPPQYYQEMVAYGVELGNLFEKEFSFDDIGYAMWSHAGDAHIHLNFLPRNDMETKRAKELMVQLMKRVIQYHGTIAAEHGLGKKKFLGKPALYYQLGDEGLLKIREMKGILDPAFLLNRGNLFDV